MNSDRYIVNRSHLNVDESNFWLQNTDTTTLFNTYLENTPITKQDINFRKKLSYIKNLSKTLNIDENRPLLPFNNRDRLTCDQEVENHWPVIPRSRPIIKPQFAVLDLPNIKNDIQYNVIHWSSNNYICAALADTIYLWHVPTSVIAQSIVNTSVVTALRLDTLGNRLAFASNTDSARKLMMWDVKKSKVICTSASPCNHKCFITCIDWHITNTILVMSCKSGNLLILTPDFKIVTLREKAHDTRAIIRVKFSANGNYLASSGEDGKIKIWTVPNLEIIHEHRNFYTSRGISWHPWRTSYLCYGTFGGELAIMNTSLGKNLHTVVEKNSIVYDLTFNPKTAELATSHILIQTDLPRYRYHTQINVLARLNHTVDRFIGHHGRILYLEWSPDGSILASAGTDETVYLWNFMKTSGKRIKEKQNIFCPDFKLI